MQPNTTRHVQRSRHFALASAAAAFQHGLRALVYPRTMCPVQRRRQLPLLRLTQFPSLHGLFLLLMPLDRNRQKLFGNLLRTLDMSKQKLVLDSVRAVALTIATVLVIELINRVAFKIPIPAPIFQLAVVFSAFKWGLIPGLLSAAAALAYALYFLSMPGHLFSYTTEHLRWIFILGVAVPSVAILVGILKRRADHAYKRLEEAEQQLVLKEKMASLGTLTAGVAHEINNPTNFILGGAQTLTRDLEQFRSFLLELAGDDIDPKIRNSINQGIGNLVMQVSTIIHGATRIRDLVRDLRTFSRLGEVEKKAIAIGESLQSTVNLVQSEFAGDMKIACELEANPTLECYPGELNQVFMNIIVNARQAIRTKQRRTDDHTHGMLIIRSRIVDEYLEIEFEDNGCGMSKETMDHIFEPFFTTKSVGEGAGLGLSISFGIVHKHGGEILVRSIENQGSCFTLLLPLLHKL
ncbi:MAG TPA: ATP-binding protein [Paucimonas sp.]|nr:ATP-binding protein [Paucimonas sp.]